MADVTAPPHLGNVVSDALRYWEPRRLLYNVVLTAVVLGHFWYFWPHSTSFVLLNNILGLFVLTVLANFCYSAAYVADVFVQLSGYRARWLRWRWLLMLIGTVFASVITHFISVGLFSGSNAP